MFVKVGVWGGSSVRRFLRASPRLRLNRGIYSSSVNSNSSTHSDRVGICTTDRDIPVSGNFIKGGSVLHVPTSQTTSVPVSALWLRDACSCPNCVHPSTRQKLFSSALLDPHVHARMSSPPPYSSSLLPIVFESKDGQRHSTEFDLAWLCERAIDQFDGEPQSKRTHQTLSPSVAAKKSLPTNLWAASEFANLRSSAGDFDYNLLMESGQSNSEDTLFALLMQLQSHGLAFIKNVPTNEVDSQHFLPQLEIIIKRLGCHIRETFYGRTWDVKSVKDAKNIAYTSLDLGLHMDLMYFESPPGIQFLHSLKNSVTGGESIFLDSYKAARILKQEYPHYYKTLTEIPVTFHYDNDSHLMKQHRFTISESDINSDAPDNLRVFYSPPFQGPFEHVRSAEDMEAVVMALRAFEDVMRRPEMLYETRLEPGTTVVFRNLRVLHGRREYDSSSGERHFKGAYMDYDVMQDRLMYLKRARNCGNRL